MGHEAVFHNALAAFEWPLQFCALVSLITYVVSFLTTNASQVDRLWTLLPVIHSAYFALLPLWPGQNLPLLPYVPENLRGVATSWSPRALLILGLEIIWSARLTYNAYRRGILNFKEEDYRWPLLRSQMPKWLYEIFNLLFISIYQNLLLMSLACPAYIAAVIQPHTSLSTSDIALAVTALVVLGLEFTADNQQWSYHTFKHAFLGKSKEMYDPKKQWPGAGIAWTPEDAKRGFVTKGLWAWSRHPNFACEQGFWWIMSLIPCLSPEPPFLPHYTFHELKAYLTPIIILLRSSPSISHALSHLPALYNHLLKDGTWLLAELMPITPVTLLTLLFLGSTDFTERVTKGKYPKAYEAYQRRVGTFSPIETLYKSLMLRVAGKNGVKEEVDSLVWGGAQDGKIKTT